MGCTNPKLRHVQGNILVKRIKDDLADTLVAPSSMDKQQFAEESELANSNVCATRSLQTFHTADANADMGCLNHTNIICTVSDSEQDGFEVAFHELDNKSLLKGRDTTRKSSARFCDIGARKHIPTDDGLA